MKTTLCFIAHSRQHHLLKICEQLYTIDEDLKKDLTIKVLNDHFCKLDVIKELEINFSKNNIAFENIAHPHWAYFKKCQYMASQKSEYIIKCDEDIYLTTHGWNNLLKGVNKVGWDKIGCYAPVITSGIPGVELFLDLYVDYRSAIYFREEFAKIKLENMWGATYENLTYDPDNYLNFFNQVKKLEHYYKGIHPLRVSATLQFLLNNYILSTDKWKEPIFDPELYQVDPVYFCNSIFMMPTKFYKEAIDGMEEGKYVLDSYDEVGLNQYVKTQKKFFMFNLNSVAVHPSYNTVGYTYETISNNFYENL